MKKILVIDDDYLIRDLIRRILVKENMEVVTAPDGASGIEKFNKQSFDLVISDIIMPGKEGLETIRELKQINPGVVILAISGGGRIHPTDYLKTASLLGADYCLEKPFDYDKLVSVVTDIINS